MTEKTLKAIELGVSTTLSIGVDWVVNKALDNAVKPKTKAEKALTMIGAAGIDLACDYAIYKMVHGLIWPSESDIYKNLVEQNVQAINENSEVLKVMAEHIVKTEDAVTDIYKKIQEGNV
ncbi:MAG: hypothetical protein IJ880_17545 [Bacilli bacterium]|nr:hypothetical protein [Bacilli bacterium]